jgi:hypothetical protein
MGNATEKDSINIATKTIMKVIGQRIVSTVTVSCTCPLEMSTMVSGWRA